MEGHAEVDPKTDQGIGCTLAILAVNFVVIGALALTFARGPYSSFEQELWYRYGSLGFLLFGAVLPAIALKLGARRSPQRMLALVGWMFLVVFLCFGYAINSGGGV